ncbi:MAG: hypothetical protein WD077_05110 [Bacteroidia bacterium]
MKKITTAILTVSVIIAMAFAACSKEETPVPVKDPTVNDPDTTTNGPDTLMLFADQTWVIQKVYDDGVEDPDHPLISAYYTINRDKTYSFTYPGFPSVSGTWEFDAAGKFRVNFMTQSSGFTWNMVSIDSEKLIAEEPQDNGTIRKFEFSH